MSARSRAARNVFSDACIWLWMGWMCDFDGRAYTLATIAIAACAVLSTCIALFYKEDSE